MNEARFTVTFGALSHDGALSLASALEEDFRLDALAVIVNEADEALGQWETALYFSSREQCDTACDLYAEKSPVTGSVPQTDWVKESLQGLPPVTAGRFFLYGSHDVNRKRSGGVSIAMDAGTAFGTGHHGTTAGCLLAIDKILKRRNLQRAFDLGCGTGVLAIAIALASKTHVLATDIDPEATRVTRNNAMRSGARHLVTARTAPGLHHATIHGAAPFDLVVANILARPLALMAHGISKLLAPGAHLILSGITLDQERWIRSSYRNLGLVTVSAMHIGNWVTLVMTLPGSNHRKASHR